MDIKSYDKETILQKLEQGVELTENEERYHMKYVLKYTDEMIDNIIAIADNDQPGVIID
ncbi:MAG: hypothetical protein Q7U77_11330 [Sediminibacterium sp.]|uniref:hypothetical protein n=1 Tax=Sediminibacterium sp. TaxID=1917865 RepID=UPI0027197FB8|nr:hypothetical protein [Sediminibacterium sp.]MDO8997210.1 hypothetical protein [Sediminibacterium sp.]